MSDDNKTNANLGAFLTKFSAPVAGIVAFITSLNGFLKLFAEKDAGLITILSLIVGILVLFGICLYYARFWKPETDDKSPSAFAPTLTDEQVKAQATKETGRKRVRLAAVAGLVLVPVLTLAGIGGWQYVQTLPTKDIIILVADFEGPDPQSYRVTETIRKNLENATEPYPDTKVKLLGKVIKDTPEQSGREVALEAGKQRKAAIVIWGWYGKTKDIIPVSANFEVLQDAQGVLEFNQEARGKIQTLPLAELESFRVQTRLSKKMAYLSLVTLGVSRYLAEDWDGAIDRFTNALQQVHEPVRDLTQASVYTFRCSAFLLKQSYKQAFSDCNQALNLKPDFADAYWIRATIYASLGDKDRAIKDFERSISEFSRILKTKPNFDAYVFRGFAYAFEGKHDQAIADLNQALKLNSNSFEAFVFRGFTYLNKRDFNLAIADYNQALKINSNSAEAYLFRGFAYSGKGDFDLAIADYTQALKLKPDNTLAYTTRGIAYREKKDYDRAIADFTQALKLKPDDAYIYYSRGWAYSNKKDSDKAIADYTQALKLKPDYAESHLLRGVLYSQRGEKQKAMDDLNAALKGLDDPKLKQRAEEELRKLE